MPLVIKNKKLYSSYGIFLKEINCPKAVERDDLTQTAEGHFQCSKCDHLILNTDLMTENDIMQQLGDNPNACLKINLANPMFCLTEVD